MIKKKKAKITKRLRLETKLEDYKYIPKKFDLK